MYGNIPDEVLEIELGETYNANDGLISTLRHEIDGVGEEVIHAVWEHHKTEQMLYPKLIDFLAWTDSKILVLVWASSGDQVLMQIPRDPVNEL